jgi:hypothetical protein
MTALTDAHQNMLDMAKPRQAYRRDQVFHVAENDAAGSEIVGTGFDLDRSVSVSLDGVSTQAAVELRVLAMTTGSLFIRIWLKWISQWGEHCAFAYYNLSPEAIAQLDSQPASAINIDADNLDSASVLGALFGHMESQQDLGADWSHDYPAFTDEIINYHGKFVLAARETEPELLNILSEAEMGTVDAQEIIDISNWLRRQPETMNV